LPGTGAVIQKHVSEFAADNVPNTAIDASGARNLLKIHQPCYCRKLGCEILL
jgi:hypothetical protein